MGRKRYYRLECAHKGCEISERFCLESRYDKPRKHWECRDHFLLKERLTPQKLKRVTTLRSKMLDGHPYWLELGEKSGSGYRFTPGCHFRTEDFPVGTKITITVEATLPETRKEGTR